MAKKLGRIVHFPNIPLALVTPLSRVNIKQIALRTVPSASKIEIRNVLQSVYGLAVHKVCTINMEGKLKYSGKMRSCYRRPDYKKAYVVLKEPVTLPDSLFPYSARSEETKSRENEREVKVQERIKIREEKMKEKTSESKMSVHKGDVKKVSGRKAGEGKAQAKEASVNNRSQYPKFAVPRSFW